mgnify:CR=1 FL=1
MAEKRKTHLYLNEIPPSIVSEATEENTPESTIKTKNPHAVALGRLGGKKGGKARAEKLTAKQRLEIAKKAAQARWKSHSKVNNDQRQ